MRRDHPNADSDILYGSTKPNSQPKWGSHLNGGEGRTETIHILVSPLTIADATGKWA